MTVASVVMNMFGGGDGGGGGALDIIGSLLGGSGSSSGTPTQSTNSKGENIFICIRVRKKGCKLINTITSFIYRHNQINIYINLMFI